MRCAYFLIGVFILSCGRSAKDSPRFELDALTEETKNTPGVDDARRGEKGVDAEEERQGVPAEKEIHDVFSLGEYRVDLISQRGMCYAEIYGFGDPVYGPNLKIPLAMKKPCFVRRRVWCTSKGKSKSGSKCASPLGSAYAYLHKDGSSDFLVTMLIGEPLASFKIGHQLPSTSLRCGQKWLYFGVQDGVFSVSAPKETESGICALKFYLEHMQKWGIDQGSVGGKKFEFPSRPKGRVRVGDLPSG